MPLEAAEADYVKKKKIFRPQLYLQFEAQSERSSDTYTSSKTEIMSSAVKDNKTVSAESECNNEVKNKLLNAKSQNAETKRKTTGSTTDVGTLHYDGRLHVFSQINQKLSMLFKKSALKYFRSSILESVTLSRTSYRVRVPAFKKISSD